MTVTYRVQQAGKLLGGTLSSAERAEVGPVLGPGLMQLFLRMGPLGQRHGYDVYRTLLAQGTRNADLLQAGLLHDVGKGRLGVPARALWVLLGAWRPELRQSLASKPRLGHFLGLRTNLRHPEAGADAVASAGGSSELVRLIRDHKQPQPQDPLLRALQQADDDN